MLQCFASSAALTAGVRSYCPTGASSAARFKALSHVLCSAPTTVARVGTPALCLRSHDHCTSNLAGVSTASDSPFMQHVRSWWQQAQNQQHNVVAASPVLAQAKKRSSGWGWLRRLLKRWHIRKRDIALLAAAAVLSVLSAGASVMTLQMLRHIGVLGSAALKRHMAALAGVVVGKLLLQFLSSTCLAEAIENMALSLRSTIFTKLLEQDMAAFDAETCASMMSRVREDVRELRDALRSVVQRGLDNAARLVGTGIALYSISPALASSLGAPIALGLVVGNLFGSRLRKLARRSKDAHVAANERANESLSQIRTVRAYQGESFEHERYMEKLRTAAEASKSVGRERGMFMALVEAGIIGLFAGVMGYGGHMVSQGVLTMGDLTSFGAHSMRLQRSLTVLSALHSEVSRAADAGERVVETLEKPVVANKPGGESWPRVQGHVAFDNVSFQYPTRDVPVFKGMSLELPRGKVTAVVGQSGSGKSTLVKLIQRFYNVNDGRVLFDGHDLARTDMSKLRNHIAVVSQEPVLFGTSIRDNVRYGSPDATDAEVEAAAQAANAHGFIQAFPHGYDTKVGERGATLSGGQRQRIVLARALLKDPKLLILDEATSSLDAKSEAEVQKALASAMKGRTVLVVAHRLSTVRDADQIAVMSRDGGKVIEQGTHEQLLAKEGVYAELVRNQQGN